MRRIAIVVLAAMLAGCASRQAAETLAQAQKAQAVFEQDMIRALNNAAKREAQLRQVMREVALDLDAKNGTYTAEEIKALVQKHENAMIKDWAASEAQINEYRKAFQNSAIAGALVAAVRGYHANGLTAGDVASGLIKAGAPEIAGIFELLQETQKGDK